MQTYSAPISFTTVNMYILAPHDLMKTNSLCFKKYTLLMHGSEYS